MFKSRICAVIISIAMIFGLCVAGFAVAGETVKLKGSATSVNTKWHQIEVGDEEGHIIAVFQNTQVWESEITGDRVTQFSRGTMDLHKKTGQGTMQGYSVGTYPNGDKRFASYEGKLMGKGQWQGTYKDIDGTGKYKGITGGGTWESKSLAPGISHVIAEGERTFQ